MYIPRHIEVCISICVQGCQFCVHYVGINQCSNGNGGCRHLCLPFPGGRTCRCAHDHLLADSVGCTPDQRCPSGTNSCLDGQTCIPSHQFCDGNLDCPDNSDENCESSDHLSLRTMIQPLPPQLDSP